MNNTPVYNVPLLQINQLKPRQDEPKNNVQSVLRHFLAMELVTEKFHYPHFFQSYVHESAVFPVRDTHKIHQSSIHHLSYALHFGMIDSDVAVWSMLPVIAVWFYVALK